MCSGVDSGLAGSKLAASRNSPTNVGDEEQDDCEQHQKRAHADDVLDGVVRVKRNAIERLAIGIHVLFDLDAVGIIRADIVQCDDVQHHEGSKPSGTATTCKEKNRVSVTSEIP